MCPGAKSKAVRQLIFSNASSLMTGVLVCHIYWYHSFRHPIIDDFNIGTEFGA